MLPFHGLQQLLSDRHPHLLTCKLTSFLSQTRKLVAQPKTETHSSTPSPEGFQAQNPPALVQPGIRCKFKCMFKERLKKKVHGGRMYAEDGSCHRRLDVLG